MAKTRFDGRIRWRTNMDTSPGAIARPLAFCLANARSTLLRLHERSGAKQSFDDAWRVAEEWISKEGHSAVELEDVYAETYNKIHDWVPRLLAMAYLREAEMAAKTDEEKSWNALMAVYFFIGVNTGSVHEFMRKGVEGKRQRTQGFVNKCVRVMEIIHPKDLWRSFTEAYGDLAERLLKLEGIIPGTTQATQDRHTLRKKKLIRKFERLASETKGGSATFRDKLTECCKEKPKPGRKRSLQAKVDGMFEPERGASDSTSPP